MQITSRISPLSSGYKKDILAILAGNLNPRIPQKVGSESEPLRGRLQPSRQNERDLLRRRRRSATSAPPTFIYKSRHRQCESYGDVGLRYKKDIR